MSPTSAPRKTSTPTRPASTSPSWTASGPCRVIGVIGSHMALNSGWHWLSGGLGVYVFFVLSGYLITTLALREERALGHLSYKAFYVRRTLRIFPLYYVAVLVYCGLLFADQLGPRDAGRRSSTPCRTT